MAKKTRRGLYFYAIIGARLLVGGMLIVAGIAKLTDPAGFAQDISHFKLLPEIGVNLLAIVLPWNEIVIGSMLILGIWTRAVALLAVILFTMFGLAVLSALARNLNISCGCFGKAGATKIGLETLLKDAIGLLLSLWIYLAVLKARVK